MRSKAESSSVPAMTLTKLRAWRTTLSFSPTVRLFGEAAMTAELRSNGRSSFESIVRQRHDCFSYTINVIYFFGYTASSGAFRQSIRTLGSTQHLARVEFV